MTIDEILKQVLKTKGSAFFYTPPIYNSAKSYFFKSPSKIFYSRSGRSLISTIEKFYLSVTEKKRGFCIVGYEAGYSFEPKLKKHLKKKNENLFRGFLFNSDQVIKYNSEKIKFTSTGSNFRVFSFRLNTTKKEYISNIKKIKSYIARGDTYQVNYTVKGKFRFEGDLVNFFKTLVFNQSAKYSAFINLGDSVIVSLSPELFFEQTGRKIITKPMKGTMERGLNIFDDNLHRYELATSEKDCAENIMIVDLLRNDIGKISEYGKVKVTEKFEVEKYESVFQMVSTVKSQLRGKIMLSDIVKNIFPCGSVTGAPKIRTMEIINELENEARGIYTGAIGMVQKDKSVFNVVIRTIRIDKNGNGEIGLGSGIVWDSDPEKEFSETILKSRFLTNPVKEFILFETMKFENCKVHNLDEHLKRLKASADYFLFRFDENKIREEINKSLENEFGLKRIKLTLNKWGDVRLLINEFPAKPDQVRVIISQKKVSSENTFQYFKTDNRKLYDKGYSEHTAKGFFDIIFLNEAGQITEGAISNIFIRKGNNWFTPPVKCGLLPGIERKLWLESDKNITENILHLDDLLVCDEIILTNSLRGRTKVDRLYLNEAEFREF